MNKVIVTGSDGFIGYHLISRLVSMKVEVWAIVVPSSPNVYKISQLPGVHVIYCDLSNVLSVIHCLPEKADVFYHLAWQGVAPELRNDFGNQIVNVHYSVNCLDLAEKLGVSKFIQPGSTNEYLYSGGLINSHSIPSPSDVYGSAKLSSKYFCQTSALSKRVDYIYTVISSIYGPDRLDNNVITYTIQKLLKREKPILTKLIQQWNYVHIEDVVSALICVGQKGCRGAFYAIGSLENKPLYEYIYTIRDLIDPTLPIGIGEKDYQDSCIPSSCIDLTEIRNDTGFHPMINFSTGIIGVIDQFRRKDKTV